MSTGATTHGELADEAFEQGFWFCLPFPVLSKSNFRRGAGSSGTKWRAEQRFRQDVAVLCGAALPAGWVRGDAADAVADRPVMAVAIVAASPLDTANLSKSVLDALESVAFVNDAQVRLDTALSERRRTDQRAVVAVARLVPGAGLDELGAAGAALCTAALDAWRTVSGRP